MNLSWESVREIVSYYNLDIEEDVIVIYDDLSLDLAPGMNVKNKCFMASIELHLKKWLGFKAQIETVQTRYGTQYPVSIGVELSSTPGLVVNIVGLIGAVAAFSSWSMY